MGISVVVKREDLIHPHVMGNKWRKLKYNLLEAKAQKKTRLVTFGGGFSNHLVAVAYAANYLGLSSKAYVRGEELRENSSPTLASAVAQGMELEFVTREVFREFRSGKLPPVGEDDYLLPEGGTNTLAVQGVAEVVDEIDEPFDILCTPVGTGGTLAGLIQGLSGNHKAWGFAVLKGDWIEGEMANLLSSFEINWKNYEVMTEYHFGGYAKYNRDLITFINTFKRDYDITLDPIYTGKMFFGVWDKIKNGQIAVGTCVLMIHTGGIQGIKGFNARFPDAMIGI